MVKSDEDGFQARPANRMMMMAPSIFDYFAEEGRIISLNLPMSYPATKINGHMVTGMMTPLRKMGDHEYPHGLLERFADAGIDYVIDPRLAEPENIDPSEMYQGWRKAGGGFVKKLQRITDHRLRAAHLLMEQEPWDVFICVIVGTDRLQHLYWDKLMPDDGADPDPIVARYYRQVDEHIGDLRDKLEPEDTLLIVSDHGFVKLHGNFMTNEWLCRQGWLTQRQARRSALYSLKLFLNKLGITRQKLSRFVSKEKIGQMQMMASHIDWGGSTAYLSGPFGIRVNLAGRQALGKVAPERFEETRDAIVTALRGMEDDHGELLLQGVYRSEELYSGEALATAPDIAFTFRDDRNYAAYAGEIGGDVFQPALGKTGDHRIDGILVAWGGGIRNLPYEARFQIWDVLPTVMHLNGRAVPEVCDGRVLTEILADTREIAIDRDWRRFYSDRKAVLYDRVQAEEITERLKALGYVSDD
jgi:predicted AlkP superfamily phosphohydrolase/phosphomutase